MKYLLVTWPEIQDYMDLEDFKEKTFYDPEKDAYFVPEDWDDEEIYTFGGDYDDWGIGPDEGDLDDAMG